MAVGGCDKRGEEEVTAVQYPTVTMRIERAVTYTTESAR
jgi:hypothetical protein